MVFKHQNNNHKNIRKTNTIHNSAKSKHLTIIFVNKYNPRTRRLTPLNHSAITMNHSNKRCKINRGEEKDKN